MGIEGFGFEGLEGVSPSFVEALYRQYRNDANSVEASWRRYFEGLVSRYRPKLGAGRLAARRQ